MTLNLVMILAGLLAGVVAVLVLVIYIRGNAIIRINTETRTPFVVTARDEASVTLTSEMDLANTGKQCAMVLDCFARHLLPYEQYDAVKVSSKVERVGAEREDDYFESVIIERFSAQRLRVTVTLAARNGLEIAGALADMVDLPIEIYYYYTSRNPWRITKQRIVLTVEELGAALRDSGL